jgi:hypothetical protein
MVERLYAACIGSCVIFPYTACRQTPVSANRTRAQSFCHREQQPMDKQWHSSSNTCYGKRIVVLWMEGVAGRLAFQARRRDWRVRAH